MAQNEEAPEILNVDIHTNGENSISHWTENNIL